MIRRPPSFWFGCLVLGLLLLARPALARVSLLLVPGHDLANSGAVFRGVKEAELNLELAGALFERLNRDSDFLVYSARDFGTGDYNFGLVRYFSEAANEVARFRTEQRETFQAALATGVIKRIDSPPHNFASESVGYILHAMNKWANDQKIDAVLHFHFNDYPGHAAGAPGRYQGLAIYVPERQFGNASSSRALAESLFAPLNQVTATSTFGSEATGVVDDQDLIAIGPNNSRQGRSLLAEYGYIYEPPITAPATRTLWLGELAFQTYRGLRQHFFPTAAATKSLPATTLLPYQFNHDLKRGAEPAPAGGEVLRLQRALQLENLYPPRAKNLVDCPLTGIFGDCTFAAVRAFQTKHQLPATGLVGPLTRAKLNALYGH